MHLERYEITANSDLTRFEFYSDGPNGIVKKVVDYQLIMPNLYNLCFGDWQNDGRVSDTVRTNNFDRNKVLATVANTLTGFFLNRPLATVYTTGSNAARTRLYQMVIAANWELIEGSYDINGLFQGDWHSFEFNKNYDAFSVTVRKYF